MSMSVRSVLAIVPLAASLIMASLPAESAIRDAVLNQDLNQFIGRNVFGLAHANLGVVAVANRDRGLIGIVGRHGEYARVSTSLLARNGVTLYAPALTAGDIKVASEANFANPGAFLAAPQVIITDAPLD